MGHTRAYLRSVLRINRIKDISSPATEFLSVIAGSVIVWYGGNQVLRESTFSASEFLGFLFIIFQIMPPIKELTNVTNRIQEATAAAKRVFEIIDVKPSVTSSPGAPRLADFGHALEFDRVSFSYDGTQPVLRDVSLTIGKGELVPVTQRSGQDHDRRSHPRLRSVGRIGRIDGADLRGLDLKACGQHRHRDAKHPFNDTIRNNIATA